MLVLTGLVLGFQRLRFGCSGQKDFPKQKNAKQFIVKLLPDLSDFIIMETGGMKGRREEMIKVEMHEYLKRSFHSASIHSEYGMTELLSQAYSKGDGIFHCPAWMKVLGRDEDDPLTIFEVNEEGLPAGQSGNWPLNGIINVIDLANIYSCSFIATEDAGRFYSNGSFEVLGRVDNSDVRGCSLMTI